jgi:hypothetical protein
MVIEHFTRSLFTARRGPSSWSWPRRACDKEQPLRRSLNMEKAALCVKGATYSDDSRPMNGPTSSRTSS